jgi:hypothetical protein
VKTWSNLLVRHAAVDYLNACISHDSGYSDTLKSQFFSSNWKRDAEIFFSQLLGISASLHDRILYACMCFLGYHLGKMVRIDYIRADKNVAATRVHSTTRWLIRICMQCSSNHQRFLPRQTVCGFTYWYQQASNIFVSSCPFCSFRARV